MKPEELRIALFSGNYNYVRDGANQALNRLVGYLLRQGAQVRVYSPTIDNPAFPPTGDLVSVPAFPIPSREEYRVPMALTAGVRRDLAEFDAQYHPRRQPGHRRPPRRQLGAAQGHSGRRLGPHPLRNLPAILRSAVAGAGRPRHAAALLPALRRDCRAGRIDRRNPPRPADERRHFDLERAASTATSSTPAGATWAGGARTALRPRKRSSCSSAGWCMEKGLEAFADAIDVLAERKVPHKVLVIGNGPAREWFEERLPGAVFTGQLTGAELGRALASADILFNPSITEAFGNVTLEAMAAGLPVVAAAATGATSLVANGVTGMLVDPSDIDAYADALEAYARDPGLRAKHGDAGLAFAKTMDWDRINGAVMHVYQRVIERRRRRSR